MIIINWLPSRGVVVAGLVFFFLVCVARGVLMIGAGGPTETHQLIKYDLFRGRTMRTSDEIGKRITA